MSLWFLQKMCHTITSIRRESGLRQENVKFNFVKTLVCFLPCGAVIYMYLNIGMESSKK